MARLEPTVGTVSTSVESGWEERAMGVIFLVGAAGVLAVCGLIQGACGSSMFSRTYSSSLGPVQTIVVNLTFYPGWLATVVLALIGLRLLIAGA